MKVCVSCGRRLGERDLLGRSSQIMEAARVSAGLRGLCFRYFTCPRCGHDHVYLEVAPLPGETNQDFQARKEDLARTVQGVRALRTTILVVDRLPEPGENSLAGAYREPWSGRPGGDYA
jgi:hypothetical protein